MSIISPVAGNLMSVLGTETGEFASLLAREMEVCARCGEELLVSTLGFNEPADRGAAGDTVDMEVREVFCADPRLRWRRDFLFESGCLRSSCSCI